MSGSCYHPVPRRRLWPAIFVIAAAMAAHPVLAQDWVELVDESAARIDAAPEVGLDDSEEKDIISGDVDNDGDVDVIIVRKVPFSAPGGRRNVLFLNDGGVFTDVTAEKIPEFLDETDDRDVLLADFDGDGWLDIVTAPTFEDNAPPPPFGQPRIYMNLGEVDGVWQGFQWEPDRMPPISPGPKNDGPQFCAVAVGDVTGNGFPDIFFSDYQTTTEDRLLINDGNGFFTDETETRFADPQMYVSAFGTDAHIVDFNLDGWNDIVRNNTLGPNEVMVVYNDGTGFFDSFDRIYNQAPYMVEPGDLNGDGRPDVYVVDDGQDHYLFNLGNDDDGHAIWEDHVVTQSPNTAGFGGNTKIADMDGDGILDILVADVDTDAPGCTRRMVILRGQGTFPDITYSDPFNGASRPWLLQGVFDVEALDVDGDGRLDLWIGTCDGNRIFMQPSAGVVELAFDPSSLTFGDVEVGTTSPPQTAMLHNTGDADATGLTFSGLPDGGFEADTSACDDTLPAGESCQVSVTFTPPEPGTAEATQHADSDEGATADLDLSGNGVEGGEPPVIDVDPESLESTLPEGGTETRPLTIANLGGETLEWEVTEEGGASGRIQWRAGRATADQIRRARSVSGTRRIASTAVAGVPIALARAIDQAFAAETGEPVPVAGGPWEQEQKLTSSDGSANDVFGISVALDGDTALVGAVLADVDGNNDQGATYVFVRSGGEWVEQAKLTASDGAAGDQFGFAVALDGDTAVVAAPSADVGSNAGQGAAWIFTRSGESWSEQAKLAASDGAAGDQFGISATVGGDTAIVGAWFADVAGSADQGAAWVFTRSGETWNEEAKLVAAEGLANDRFGYSVAVEGDTALVGALQATIDGNTSQGAAYVFTRSQATWTEETRLTASDGAAGDNFGISVTLDAGTAVIGAPSATVGGNAFRGAIYVFAGTSWVEEAKLIASDGVAFDQLGWSVELDGDILLASAPGFNFLEGAAYVFTRDGATWSEEAKLIADDGESFHEFGFNVALDGNRGFIGASRALVNGNFDQGAAYMFVRDATEPLDCTLPDWVSVDPTSGSVPAGGEQAADVTFDTTGLDPGAYEANLCLASNDPVTPLVAVPLSLTVEGGGEGPIADITPESFAFVVPEGGSDSDTLNIGNIGDADLTWSIDEAELGAVVPEGAPYRYGLAGVHEFHAPVGADRASAGLKRPASVPADPVVLPAPQPMGVNELTEGFDDISQLPGAGWALINNSEPTGPSSWFQGNDSIFPSHEGEPDAYIAANFESTDGSGDISNWLITPEVTIVNGTQITFWTRTSEQFEEFFDRLEVRLSVAGDSTDVGDTAESVGDFKELLLTINPDLGPGEYPEEWTQYVLTVRERSREPVTGRFAFRYWVTDSGPDGTNGDYIGIDTVSVMQPGDGGEGCANPVDIPWLSATPEAGTTAPGDSEPVDVAVDATDIEMGEHTAQLCVTTNDPNAPLVEIPVHLNVIVAQDTWEPLDTGTTQDLYAVHFVDDDVGYVAGATGTVLKTTDGGETWEEAAPDIDQDLYGVHFFDAEVGVVVGSEGTIERTLNGGADWIAVTSGTSETLYDVSFAGSLGLTVGSALTILRSENQGESWEEVHGGFFDPGFFGVDMVDNSAGFVAGQNAIFQPLFGFTSDGGLSFDFVPFYFDGNEGRLEDVRFIDALKGNAVGVTWDGQGAIAFTEDGGQEWSTTLFSEPLYAVDFIAGETGYAAGAMGTMLKTTDGGETWEPEQSGTAVILNAISIPTPSTGYAVGNGGTVLKGSISMPTSDRALFDNDE